MKCKWAGVRAVHIRATMSTRLSEAGQTVRHIQGSGGLRRALKDGWVLEWSQEAEGGCSLKFHAPATHSLPAIFPGTTTGFKVQWGVWRGNLGGVWGDSNASCQNTRESFSQPPGIITVVLIQDSFTLGTHHASFSSKFNEAHT